MTRMLFSNENIYEMENSSSSKQESCDMILNIEELKKKEKWNFKQGFKIEVVSLILTAYHRDRNYTVYHNNIVLRS